VGDAQDAIHEYESDSDLDSDCDDPDHLGFVETDNELITNIQQKHHAQGDDLMPNVDRTVAIDNFAFTTYVYPS
jgi:hypothetical protein